MCQNAVVTRFAPSNTGTGGLHLGSARTALYSYAYAKKMGGKCLLRIEDTDKVRSNKESLDSILMGLKWLGLKFDGEPLYQSQRSSIYNQYIDKLISENKAYLKDGATIFRMPPEDVVVNDLILGEVIYPASQLQDFAIRRADGGVLFHACVVIDDALSGVTHVIRANDHLANTPKHIQLYKALGFKVPEYAHMPLLLDDKGAKLSKRRTDQFVLIKDFKKSGILPETVVNMLGLMGWSPKEKGLERFDLDYICKNFDIKDCGKANARYDQKKILALNGARIASMDVKDFSSKLHDFALENVEGAISGFGANQIPFYEFSSIYHQRAKTLLEPFRNGEFLYKNIVYNLNDVEECLLSNNKEGMLILGDYFYHKLMYLQEWKRDKINTNLNSHVNAKGIKLGKLIQPLRVALTGQKISPPIDDVLFLLGKDRSVKRITECIETLNK